ncbi:FecR domain-containing protein [Shewanella avicenniae]|uniref:FecR domain-containing protein n=1 Tax=Shewanella avicenniae TaxID=2814294 RepID=A0ABX7QPB8_9GAMM|nr:FecR domain-containing protein [Shewanella avicenniae]QSX32573.1 FecR domain-containing protein [Shewanella avicenniae]
MPRIVKFPNSLERIQSEAASWISRIQTGKLSDSEQAELRAWVSQSKTHEHELRVMSENWDRLQSMADRCNETASQPRDLTLKDSKHSSQWSKTAIRLVAAVALIVTIPFMYIELVNQGLDQGTNGQYATAVGTQKTLTLADGSIVTLNTDSKLVVNYNDDIREITLVRGEANFDVAKDKQHPFIVKAGHGDVQALGTSFAVRLEGETVDVLVSHGTVRVRADEQVITKQQIDNPEISSEEHKANHQQQVVLATAGKRVVFDQKVVKSVTEEPKKDLERHLYWKRGFLDFTEQPLTQVVEEVSRYTNYKIIISSPTLNQLRVGGYYPINNLDTVFETLEMNFNLDVKKLENGTFIIKEKV